MHPLDAHRSHGHPPPGGPAYAMRTSSWLRVGARVQLPTDPHFCQPALTAQGAAPASWEALGRSASFEWQAAQAVRVRTLRVPARRCFPCGSLLARQRCEWRRTRRRCRAAPSLHRSSRSVPAASSTGRSAASMAAPTAVRCGWQAAATAGGAAMEAADRPLLEAASTALLLRCSLGAAFAGPARCLHPHL